MPRLSLDTNLPSSKIPDDFLSGALKVLSNTLGKGPKVSTYGNNKINFRNKLNPII